MASCRLASASVLWIFSIEFGGHRLAARQHFRQVHGADRRAGAGERALNLHQATGIERDHGAARRCARWHRSWCAPWRRKAPANFTAKVPPKPQHSSAASISRNSRPRTLRQQPARTVLDAQFAQRVAAIVKGHDVFQARAHIFHAGHFGQERGELPDARRQRFGRAQAFPALCGTARRNGARSSTVQEPDGTTTYSASLRRLSRNAAPPCALPRDSRC